MGRITWRDLHHIGLSISAVSVNNRALVDISIIIPTRNRASILARTLESIQRCVQPNSARVETLVVDNGSTDDTANVSIDFASETNRFPIRRILEETPGLHAGRHRGLAEANGDILLFADDDIEPTETWITAVADMFTDTSVVLGGGKCLPLYETTPPEWLEAMWEPVPQGGRMLAPLSLIDQGDTSKTSNPHYIFGCNFAIRKTTLLDAGGFHPDGMPPELIRYRGDGETYISQYVHSKGLRAYYQPEASVCHYVSAARMTEEYFHRRFFNQGISDSYSEIRSTRPLVNTQEQSKWLRGIRRLKVLVLDRIAKSFATTSASDETRNPHGQENIAVSPDTERLRQVCRDAYKEGVIWHRKQVKQSPELLAWIQRKDYLGAAGICHDRTN
jgi:glycosyltransferase involved in cell wall biosynthesis